MRTFIAASLIVLLAACGGKPEADANEAAAANATVPAPAGDRLAQWREDSVNGCIGGARDTVRDPNLPVERHCVCAVERVMAGKALAALEADEASGAHDARFRAALRQCIAEISPDYPLRRD